MAYFPIQHITREWRTIFVEWYISSNKNQGSYIINNNEITGVFTCQIPSEIQEVGISIGGRYGRSQLLTGAISALEIYSTKKDKCILPIPLKQLIITNQLISVQSPSPGRRKRRKENLLKNDCS